jgi:hypothetical protein
MSREYNRVHVVALTSAERVPYRGLLRKMASAMWRPAPPRVWVLLDIVFNVLFWVFLLLMLAVACGLVGDVPEHDRIPVAAIFRAVVAWINN